MPGLLHGLAQNPLFNVGAGLLGSAGNPLNPYGGIQHGLLATQQARRADMLDQYTQMQMQQMAQQEYQRRVAAAQEAAERENQEAYLRQLEATDPQKAAMIRAFPNMAEDLLKPTPQFAAPVEMTLPDGRKVMTQQDPKTGKLSVLGGSGVTVNVGEGAKPLGNDANKWIHPETGAMPGAMMTMQEATAHGFRLKSDSEIKKEARAATIAADKEELENKLLEARANYDKAAKAFESSPSSSTKREMDNAAAALKTAIAGMENWRGEPSEGVAGRFSVPGAVGSVIEKAVDRAIGASPPEKEISWDEL